MLVYFSFKIFLQLSSVSVRIDMECTIKHTDQSMCMHEQMDAYAYVDCMHACMWV
jgi:hypothetical protein